jgi:tRNA(Ile)-lysidine synthetase-like protein
MITLILSALALLAVFPLWAAIHEYSHLRKAKQLVGVQWYKMFLYPHSYNGVWYWARISYILNRQPNSWELYDICLAPRTPDLWATLLLPFSAIFGLWPLTILLAGGAIDMFVGSLGISDASDLKRAAHGDEGTIRFSDISSSIGLNPCYYLALMFKLTHQLPSKCIVAVSGGVDSMSALHFLYQSNKVEGVIHINHGTGKFADEAEELVQQVCQDYKGLPLFRAVIKDAPPKGESKEAYWRDKRYGFFRRLAGPRLVVLAHNMNDCLEEYIMCTMVRGFEGTIPYQRENCIRPFRLWKRDDIYEYAKRNKLKWIEDPSNKDPLFRRNYIRTEILPRILKLNPGVWNIVEKLIQEEKVQTNINY